MALGYLWPPMSTDVHRGSVEVRVEAGGHAAVCGWRGCGWRAPARQSHDAATADAAGHSADVGVVVTDVDTARGTVIALPLVWAAAQLRAYATLAGARTFAEARQDPYAAFLVDDWAIAWAEDERELHGRRVTGADDDPFDAEELWGIDSWRVWWPDPLVLQQLWLDSDGGDTVSFLDTVDDEETLLAEDTPPVIPIAAREDFEAAVRATGWQVRRLDSLVESFRSAPTSIWAAFEPTDADFARAAKLGPDRPSQAVER